MKFAVAFLFAALPLALHAQNQWTLVQSTLTWHITHPVHEVDGTSHDAKGTGNCSDDRRAVACDGTCAFGALGEFSRVLASEYVGCMERR